MLSLIDILSLKNDKNQTLAPIALNLSAKFLTSVLFLQLSDAPAFLSAYLCGLIAVFLLIDSLTHFIFKKSAKNTALINSCLLFFLILSHCYYFMVLGSLSVDFFGTPFFTSAYFAILSLLSLSFTSSCLLPKSAKRHR